MVRVLSFSAYALLNVSDRHRFVAERTRYDGLIFWLIRNRLFGSYFNFTLARRG